MNSNLGNSTYTFKTHVVPKLNYAAIIGKDFLQHNDCVIDFKSGYLKISRDNIVPFLTSTSENSTDDSACDFHDELPFFNSVPENNCAIFIHAADTIEIPANSESVIPATFRENDLTETTGIIEPNESLAARFNICGASALVTVSASGLVPFRLILINPNSKPVKIFRFTNLGRFLRSEENIVNILALSDESYNDSTPQGFSQYHEVSETETDYDISHDLTLEHVQQLEQLLIQNADIFSQGPHDLGRTSIIRHEITTNGSPPIRQRPYRTAPPQRELITQHITSMLEADIIEPSVSPWASPVVLVKKKDGSTWFCIDYRKLNAVTKKDSYPLPHIQESLDLLGQTQDFTTLDLFSGYWQVEMNESSKEFTAFTTYDGLYQFKVLPFGLCNAPSTFQRFMESVLRGLNWKICLIYIDDIIIFSKSFEEHLAHIDLVFTRLRAANIKLKASKCHFAYPQVTYLRHIVSRHGIQPDPDKVSHCTRVSYSQESQRCTQFLGSCELLSAFY